MTAKAEIIRIEKPGPPAIVATLAPIVASAQAFLVRDKDEHELALLRMRSLNQGKIAIREHFAPAQKAAQLAHKSIVAAVAAIVDPIEEAARIYDHKAAEFEAEQARKAAAEAERLAALARQQEEERAQADAMDAELAGDSGLAQQILEAEVTVPVITVAPEIAKVAGVSTQERWSAEVVDMLALVRYVAERPEWLVLLEANMVALNRMAVTQRSAMTLPGVRPVSKSTRVTRRG